MERFRQATPNDAPQIWKLLQDAIERRRQDGSEQWQDGYPNPDVIAKDTADGAGYVLTVEEEIAGYCAIMINNEPAYAKIVGQWITDGDFVVYHRVAISTKYLGQGLAKKLLGRIEDYAHSHHIQSIKVDTSFDNKGMLNILEQLNYVYCGTVEFRGSPRMAFQKLL